MQDRPHICFTFVGDVTRDSRLRRFREAAAELGAVTLVTLLSGEAAKESSPGSEPGSDAGDAAAGTEGREGKHASDFFHVEKRGEELRFRPRTAAGLRRVLPRFWRSGAQAAQMLDADLYIAADLYSLPAAASAARQGGRPLIYDARELYRSVAALVRRPLMQFFWRMLERRYAPEAQAVITVNDSIAGILRKQYADVRVIRNLPDWQPPAPSDRLRVETGISAERVLLLSQGGLQRGRGALLCIDALQHLPECDLVFLGDGAMREEIRLHAQVGGMAERVHFLPGVPSAELPAWTASADIGLCMIENLGTSYYLSLPNKLFEYIAAGLPVVGSDFPEISAVLQQTGAGITAAPSSGESIADAIRTLLDDRDAFEHMRECAVDAAQRFRWQHEKPAFLNTLREILYPTN